MPLGDVWRNSWASSWASHWKASSVAPTPTPVTQRPAGKARRRYVVEIDGVDFEVADLVEAQELLQKAKTIAIEVAPRAIKTANPIVIKKGIESLVPKIISRSPETDEISKAFQKQLSEIYLEAKSVYDKGIKAKEYEEQRLRIIEDDEEVQLLILLEYGQ